MTFVTKLLYLAKECGPGVKHDLQSFSNYDITICACNPGYVDYYKLLGYNVITHHKFFTTVDMRFDVIIGNPPYSDRSKTNCFEVGGSGKSLDDKFTLKCIQLGNRVSLIIRSKEFSKVNSKFKRKLFSGHHLRSITHVDKSVFPSVQNTATCIIDWDSEYVGETVITYEDGSQKSTLLGEDSVVKMNNPNYVSSVDNNMRHRYLRGITPRHTIDDNDNGTRIVEIMGKGTTPIIRYTQSKNCVGVNTHGVVMNYNSSWSGFDKMYVKEYDAGISESVIMLRTDGVEESKQLIKHLTSPEIVELMTGLKSGFSNSGRIFEMIPDWCDS